MTAKVRKVYSNEGNVPLIELLPSESDYVLDVGCGSGDNAALIRTTQPNCKIFGVTHSIAEAALAKKHMIDCMVFDIENPIPTDLEFPRFDAIIFSHVLEHVRDPAAVLARFLPLVQRGGLILIAVPNVLSWRLRVKFVLGQFEYESSGPLDDTHLRFFTYYTADRYLVLESNDLKVICKKVSGSIPLWWLRRYVFPARLSKRIDKWGCDKWPNIFGEQVLLVAEKM